jgi:hypothetical protein
MNADARGWCGAVSIARAISKNGANSVHELIEHITSFIDSYNETARPFFWTKSAVHQKRLKPCFAL